MLWAPHRSDKALLRPRWPPHQPLARIGPGQAMPQPQPRPQLNGPRAALPPQHHLVWPWGCPLPPGLQQRFDRLAPKQSSPCCNPTPGAGACRRDRAVQAAPNPLAIIAPTTKGFGSKTGAGFHLVGAVGCPDSGVRPQRIPRAPGRAQAVAIHCPGARPKR